MTKSIWSLPWRFSIFTKLLAIMLGMIAVLLAIVTAIFALIIFPTSLSTSEHAARQYTLLLAANEPNLEAANNIHKEIGLDIRYEGPDGSWATSDRLPTIALIRNGQAHSSFGHEFHLVAASNGGTYLFAWDVRDQMHSAHVKLLWALLLMIVGVVLTAYWFQKRLLRPVQSLGNGVARMTAGQLNVVLPVVTHDELGVLTTAFNQMVSRVQEMIHARDQLLLDVSHELRSPLTRMKVALALLPEDENKAGLDGDVKEMEAMISELLELERLRTPHGLHKHEQDVVPILREVADLFENRAPGVRVIASPEPIFANVDYEKLRTVLRNLLDNAFKYSLPDSQPVILSVSGVQGCLIVRVQDDGQGVTEVQSLNIFEPFFRIDPSRSKKTGGYGLGLSMCKRIVEAHGGTIQVEHNPGRGICFTLKIPGVA
ncbi:MAG TPA: HAMP domain-containing sensor histidine kinase [Candidatus Sulfotelmatobacter sp.]|nr:HAMP domain-containing sensor histidine kinase [Candidatus Sulfotelmatobacter sp.]